MSLSALSCTLACARKPVSRRVHMCKSTGVHTRVYGLKIFRFPRSNHIPQGSARGVHTNLQQHRASKGAPSPALD